MSKTIPFYKKPYEAEQVYVFRFLSFHKHKQDIMNQEFPSLVFFHLLKRRRNTMSKNIFFYNSNNVLPFVFLYFIKNHTKNSVFFYKKSYENGEFPFYKKPYE